MYSINGVGIRHLKLWVTDQKGVGSRPSTAKLPLLGLDCIMADHGFKNNNNNRITTEAQLYSLLGVVAKTIPVIYEKYYELNYRITAEAE